MITLVSSKEQLGKSFIYIRKSNGPNVLPLGIPQLIVCIGDSVAPSIRIRILLSP